MFAKIAVLLFAGCAVALARPQDASALQQAQNQYLQYLQRLNPNQPQYYNPNQPQGWSQFQGLNPSQLQGLNQNQFPVLGQLQNLIPALNNGQNNGLGNSKYQSPILDVPNHFIDWSQNVVDTSMNHVGSALGQAYDNTERVVHNAADTVNEVGRRGLQDGTNLFKTGVGLISTIPRLGFGLLSRNNNNNNNNGFGF